MKIEPFIKPQQLLSSGTTTIIIGGRGKIGMLDGLDMDAENYRSLKDRAQDRGT